MKNHDRLSMEDILQGILYGIINLMLLIPVTISFCSIIFRDPAFQEYMPQLVKLVMFSSAIHQLIFSSFSTLPFAIGQVQDAGLIFLSAMAANIAKDYADSQEANASSGLVGIEYLMPTTLFILAICTSLLGVLLIIVSRLKLASLVQYLPMPVIGGYLAFIGFFCLQAGLSLMSAVNVSNFTQWHLYFTGRAPVLLLPGVAAGLMIYVLMIKLKSSLVLPACLMSVLLIFYAYMYGYLGMSIEEMREFGWIAPYSYADSPLGAWQLYDVSAVKWSLLPQQLTSLVAMFLVVAFSSSLDVAAIEMELGKPLDYNKELQTVGLSNLVSGVLGGYTGSYIFSQTIFNMRRKVTSRLAGCVVIGGELFLVLLPISVPSYIPKIFFGALLVFIGIDLMIEWLIDARHKMHIFEYFVCLVTFVAIQAVGIELGMLLGVLAAMVCFVVQYARMSMHSNQVVSVATLQSSTMIRTFEQRTQLLLQRGKIVTVTFKGYIFFASAVQLLDVIKSKLVTISTDINNNNHTSSSNVSSNHSSSGTIDNNTNNNHNTAITNNHTTNTPNVAAIHSPSQSNKLSSISSSCSSDKDQSFVSPTKKNSASSSSSSSNGYTFSLMMTPRQNTFRKSTALDSPTKSNKPTSNSNSSNNKQNKSTTKEVSEEEPNERTSFLPKTTQQSNNHTNKAKNSYGSTTTTISNNNSPIFSNSNSSNTDNWIVGEDLEQPSSTEQNTILNTIIPAATDSSSKGMVHSTSLLKLVWESQSQLREKQQLRFRSMSDLAENNINNSSNTSNNNSASNSPKIHHHPLQRGKSFNSNTSNLLLAITNNNTNTTAVTNNNHYETLSGKHTLTPTNTYTNTYISISPTPPEPSSTTTATTIDDSSNNNNSSIATEYLVLDFAEVLGVDATAARSCFLTLVQWMRGAQVSIVFAGLRPELEQLLRAHRVLTDESIVIASLDDALEWCEDQLLKIRKTQPVVTPAVVPGGSHVCHGDVGSNIDNKINTNTNNTITNTSNAPSPHPSDSNPATSQVTQDYLKLLQVREEQQRNILKTLNISPHINNGRSVSRDGNEVMTNNNTTGRKPRSQSFNLDTSSLSTTAGTNNAISKARLIAGLSSSKDLSAARLRTILEDYLEVERGANDQINKLLDSRLLVKYFKRESVAPYQLVFDINEPSTKIYFIEQGAVEIVTISPAYLEQCQHPAILLPVTQQQPHAHATNTHALQEHELLQKGVNIMRVNKVCDGGCFGEADFFIGRNHSVRAYTIAETVFWTLDKASFAAMEVRQPQLCMLLQHALLKSLAISSTWAMYALHPTTAYAAANNSNSSTYTGFDYDDIDFSFNNSVNNSNRVEGEDLV